MKTTPKTIRNGIILAGIVWLILAFFFKPFIIALTGFFKFTMNLCGAWAMAGLPGAGVCSAMGSLVIAIVIYLTFIFLLGSLVGMIAGKARKKN